MYLKFKKNHMAHCISVTVWYGFFDEGSYGPILSLWRKHLLADGTSAINELLVIWYLTIQMSWYYILLLHFPTRWNYLNLIIAYKICFSSSYSVSEFFDAREYTTDAGDDSDLDSTDEEDIEEEDDEEEDETLEEENVALKENHVLETSSSRDDSEIVAVNVIEIYIVRYVTSY